MQFCLKPTGKGADEFAGFSRVVLNWINSRVVDYRQETVTVLF